MAVSNLSYKKTSAEATYVLDRDLCYVAIQPKLVLPCFSSDDEPDLKWALELHTDASCLKKKSVVLTLERNPREKEVKAKVYVKVTSDVPADDLENYCKTTAKERKPEDFSLLYYVIFQEFNEHEKCLGSFYIYPEVMKKLTVHAIVDVTDGTLQEIVKYPETPGQINMRRSRLLKHLRALSGSLSQLLHSGEFSDITIRVEGKTIPAHQNILAARSDVFKAMFTGKFKEQLTKVIDIKDAGVNVVELLLRFMYTGTVDVGDNLLVELLMCADKYMVQDLSTLCQDRLAVVLRNGGSVTQLCETLKVAHLLDSKTLMSVAIGYLKARKDVVFQSREWKQFSKSHRSVAAVACLEVLS